METRNKKAITILSCVIAATLAFIWIHSCMGQEESAEESGFFFEVLGPVLEIFAGKGNVTELFIRKLAHFTEFMILGILAKVNYEGYYKTNTILYPLLFSMLYACSDELHQLFVPGRFCAFKDVMIDSSGAFVGIALYHLITSRWKRKPRS